MGFNRFYRNIIANVILITLGCLGFVFFLFEKQQPASSIILAGITIILTGRLIYYLNRTNRMLDHFFTHMKEQDPTILLSGSYIEQTFRGLQDKLQHISDEMKKERIEKEVHAKYLQTIVDNVNAGILTCDQTGKIELINKAAKKYFGLPHLSHIDDLAEAFPGLTKKLKNLGPGGTVLEKITSHGNLFTLSFKAVHLKSMGESYTIITFQDIKTELEEQEIESWKKLIRIITHEIMNSMTPIVNITNAIKRKIGNGITSRTAPNMQETLSGVDIIEERSQGIIHFICQYKKLTKLPPLQLSDIDISQLFDKIEYLFSEQLKELKINFISETRHTKALSADPRMIEQVLINLVKNSIEALNGISKSQIKLKSILDVQNRILIQVLDNGCGIPDKFKEEVFVPFFSTKKDGSGIGLSLSKQIMRLHKGEINLDSHAGKGTLVNLRF